MAKPLLAPALTQARLRELLRYEPETGLFICVKKYGRGSAVRCVGDIIGWPNGDDGRIRFGIDGKQYLAHRVAWFWMTGKWPYPECDHKDTNPANNRWSNLREAMRSQNAANTRIMKNNTSGIKGVSWGKKERKWYAKITVNRKQISLGHFDCPVIASCVFALASDKAFGEFARAA